MNNNRNYDFNSPDLPQDLFSRILDSLKTTFTGNQRAIRIAVIGETGVGKTSTLNALFNTNMPVSHFGSCTQKAETVTARTAKGALLEVIDLPGLWAGEAETIRHWETYKTVIPTVDSVVWIISAGDRALEGMQKALKTIASFSGAGFIDRVVFGVNKAEHMYPENWNTAVNQPSPEQEYYLKLFCNTVKTAIQEKFPNWRGEVRYFSAHKKYRLDELLEQMLLTADKENVLRIAKAADPGDARDLINDKRALKLAEEMTQRKEHR